VSPPLKFTSTGTLALSIKIGGFSPPTPDNLEVWVGKNNPNPSLGNYVLAANLSYMSPNNIWLDTIINITTAYDTTYVAFKYKTIGAAWWTPLIDSLKFKTNWASGIFEEEIDPWSIQSYPNPVLHQLSFDFGGVYKNEEVELVIYSLFGSIVLEKNIQHNQSINIDLPNGTYFYTSNGTKNNRLAKGRFVVLN
jgi:hypothetical protein